MSILSPVFTEALAFAAQLHQGQTRKGTRIPYVSHLLAVCSLVLESGGDEEEAIAALLHDAVEDQGGAPMLEIIRRRFGERVARIVDGCTDTDQTPKPPWKERKQNYIQHVRHAPPDVLRVSLADKVHNARSILFDFEQHGMQVFDRFSAERRETLWYYRALVSAFREASPMPLIDELDRVVSELEARTEGHESVP